MSRSILGRVAFVLALTLGIAPTHAGDEETLASTAKPLREDLLVRAIAPGVWIHTTFRSESDGSRTPANGLLINTGEASLMIDTGWSSGQTERLLAWAVETLGQPVEHLIVTHAHPDRTGGLEAVRSRPVIVHGHALTDQRIRGGGDPAMHWSFEFQERLEIGGEQVDLFYPGPGHAPDNVVVWLPRRKILFGGCLIKGADARNLGYVGDADLQNWPLAIRRIIQTYREAEIVVPGHGSEGGVELLSHTMELLEATAARAPEKR